MKNRIRNAWAVLRGRAVVCTHGQTSNVYFDYTTAPMSVYSTNTATNAGRLNLR